MYFSTKNYLKSINNYTTKHNIQIKLHFLLQKFGLHPSTPKRFKETKC
jgi:hypothetical protein